MKYKYIYGPVASWRLGRSLGIDPVYTGPGKTCSFDCVYCQVGKTGILTAERKIFVPTEKIIEEIKALPPLKIDYITFSGAGEPTLAKNLGGIIKEIRKIRKATEGSPATVGSPEHHNKEYRLRGKHHKEKYRPRGTKIAILTNSSIIDRKDVREDLALADFVVAKLDAYSEELFVKINKPAKGIKFNKIVNGLKEFRSRYKGKLALQIMFIGKNKNYAKEIADLACRIDPDEIQINTPLRPCDARPLPKEQLDKIKEFFRGANYVRFTILKRKRLGL